MEKSAVCESRSLKSIITKANLKPAPAFGKFRISSLLFLIILAASSVSSSEESTVDLLLEDSSIGDSEIRLWGHIVGSIVDVDSSATTYDIACATTGTFTWPLTTPACVGGEHFTITQGPNTMFLSQVYITTSTSRNYREECSFSNRDTVTCSMTNTISEIFTDGDQTKTTSYTQSSSGVHKSPVNGPLYYTVTITAGAEKIESFKASPTSEPTATGSSNSKTSSPTSSSANESTSKPSGGTMVTAQAKVMAFFLLSIAAYLAV